MSENEILKRIRNDGQQQLALIYEKYRSEFLHWIVKEFHCSPEDSKDIYQITILIFYDNVKSGKLEYLVSSIKTYLFGVGKNVVREHLRKIKRDTLFQQERSLREYFVDEPNDQIDECIFEAANKAVAKLGANGRKLIELFYFERKSMKEISTILKYNNSATAKNQKCKSMARLRKLFEEEMNTYQKLSEVLIK